MKVIKSVGFTIPSNLDDNIKIDSLSSLSECDIVLFDVNLKNCNYTHNQYYMGKPTYDEYYSTKIKEHIIHWQKEITNYLNSGKTLFINLSAKNEFYLQTGRKEYSGTGRNRQVTNLVQPYSNFDFLPKFPNINFQNAHGKTIISLDSKFTGFLNDFNDYMSYETYISDSVENIFPCFTTKNKDKILGGILKIEQGNVILLPYLNFDISTLINKDDSYTKEAMILGKKLYNHLAEIDSILTQKINKTPRPSWIDQETFSLKESIEIKSKIESKKKSIDKLTLEITKLEEDYTESEKLNNLLFETGKELEDAVILALTILGYKAENFDDGILEIDQVILSPEGDRYIGECEGKDNKQIDITKFRQLLDSLNEDFEREEINEKAYGILFGNPFRLSSPYERKEGFTIKCINGAKREAIGLIETTELYRVAKYLSENIDEDFKYKCRETIKKNLGKVIKFPKSTN